MRKNFNEYVAGDKNVLIISSKPLDLDSLGSGLILKKYLESLRKNVRLFFPRPMTKEEKNYNNFLPYINEIEDKDTRETLKKNKFDLLILLDGTNLIQFYDNEVNPNNPPILSFIPRRIRIDHHPQNPESLETFNFHFPKSSSTAEIILSKIVPKNFIDKNIATLGYAAILGDTGNFNWNFLPSTLKLASLLLSKGADWETILNRSFFSKSQVYFEMLAYAIQNSEYYKQIATCFLFLPYRKLRQDKIDDSKIKNIKQTFQDNFARRVEGFPRGILVYENKKGQIHISARGNTLTNKINFPKVFMEIGGNGGGHFNACGFDVKKDFQKFKESIIQVLSKYSKV